MQVMAHANMTMTAIKQVRLVKRRLRKKLHLCEFQELGFYLSYQLASDLIPEAANRHWEELIDCIEANKLVCAGGGDTGGLEYFVAHVPKGSVSPEQRKAVEDWLTSREEVISFQVGPLLDAWHDQEAAV